MGGGGPTCQSIHVSGYWLESEKLNGSIAGWLVVPKVAIENGSWGGTHRTVGVSVSCISGGITWPLAGGVPGSVLSVTTCDSTIVTGKPV